MLYRASVDGDLAKNFHKKCDGKKNTVTFIKSTNGKRFGGFQSEEWNSRESWINDVSVFLFSLDNHECYYYNNNGYMAYDSSSYGPIWGYSKNSGGYDLYLNNKWLSNNSSMYQGSFNYKGKNYALCGNSNFKVEDYETYELILE